MRNPHMPVARQVIIWVNQEAMIRTQSTVAISVGMCSLYHTSYVLPAANSQFVIR